MQLLCSVFLCVFRTLTVPCSVKKNFHTCVKLHHPSGFCWVRLPGTASACRFAGSVCISSSALADPVSAYSTYTLLCSSSMASGCLLGAASMSSVILCRSHRVASKHASTEASTCCTCSSTVSVGNTHAGDFLHRSSKSSTMDCICNKIACSIMYREYKFTISGSSLLGSICQHYAVSAANKLWQNFSEKIWEVSKAFCDPKSEQQLCLRMVCEKFWELT